MGARSPLTTVFLQHRELYSFAKMRQLAHPKKVVPGMQVTGFLATGEKTVEGNSR